MKHIPLFRSTPPAHPLFEQLSGALATVIVSGAFIGGEFVRKFEEELSEYIGNQSTAICCANGSDALEIALIALQLPAGSSVIVPDFTFAAPAEAVVLRGLRPIFCDVDPQTGLLDMDMLRKLIHKQKISAVIAVHLFGQGADILEIMNLCQPLGIPIIEDNAQSLGAALPDGRKLGTIADIGISSFFPTKILGGCGDGGVLFTKDRLLAEKIRLICSHGAKTKYFHETIGRNSRLDALQAAYLSVKLKNIDTTIEKRQSVARFYQEIFKPTQWAKPLEHQQASTHVYHQFCIRLVNRELRDSFKSYLESHGLGTALYYPFPLSVQPAFKDFHAGLPPSTHSAQLCSTILALPMHEWLEAEELETIKKLVETFDVEYVGRGLSS